MKLSVALIVGFICSEGGIDAFSFTSLRSQNNGILYNYSNAQRCMRRQECILCMKDDQSSAAEQQAYLPSNNLSRRSALRQCASFCISAMASTQIQQQPAGASSFSDSPITTSPRPAVETEPLPPQFSSKNTVVTSKAPLTVAPSQPSSSPPVATVTTITAKTQAPSATPIPLIGDSSHPNTVPTNAWDGTDDSKLIHLPPSKRKKLLPKGALPELALATFCVSSLVYFFSDRPMLNEPGKPPKVKLVMIEPEPYGMDKGRRYYNGVDVTINDPILKADIRESCDAGVVSNECAESIAGFIGEVSNERRGSQVSPEQVEKATAVINYLDSLSSGKGINGNTQVNGDTSTKTAAAFYSYLNEVSAGNLPAPSSAASVASYLDSIDVHGNDSLDGYQRAIRLMELEAKMNRLEQSVERLPTEIFTRIQDWQQGQDDRLSEEIRKIRTFLIQRRDGDEDPELISKMTGEQPIDTDAPFL